MHKTQALYENPELRNITGSTLRPGGLELTWRGLGLCGFAPGDKVLDAGCGPGESLALMLSMGLTAWGLDKSPALLAEAAGRGPALRGDIQSIPLQNAVLHGVLAECVLSLMPDKAEALGELHRVLKPGGKILLSDLYLRGGADAGGEAGSSCIAGAETLPRLYGLLEGAGFKILHILDETRSLKELAVNMIFKYGSPAAFFERWGLGCSSAEGGAPGKNLGYAMIIAEKI